MKEGHPAYRSQSDYPGKGTILGGRTNDPRREHTRNAAAGDPSRERDRAERHGLGTRRDRLLVLEHQSARETGLLTERTRRRLWRARHGATRHVEAQVPGELVCLDTFYGFVERLQQTILHEHWRVVFRRTYFTGQAALDRTLQRFMRFYSFERPHHGLSRAGSHAGDDRVRRQGGGSLSS
jgi:hypothetical protein